MLIPPANQDMGCKLGHLKKTTNNPLQYDIAGCIAIKHTFLYYILAVPIHLWEVFRIEKCLNSKSISLNEINKNLKVGCHD